MEMIILLSQLVGDAFTSMVDGYFDSVMTFDTSKTITVTKPEIQVIACDVIVMWLL